MSRREKIEEMLKDQPEDNFLRYTLAMEMEKTDECDAALDIYKDLMAGIPPYVPAFFMAGQMLYRIDRSEEAVPILEQGIAEATTQGDLHAAGEMREFLGLLN